jgi:hypothetical protein
MFSREKAQEAQKELLTEIARPAFTFVPFRGRFFSFLCVLCG